MSTINPNNATVISKEIKHVEASIKSCYDRLELLECILSNQVMDEREKKVIETELTEMKKRLHTNREILDQLNKQSQPVMFYVGAAFALAVFLVWMIYILVNGRDY